LIFDAGFAGMTEQGEKCVKSENSEKRKGVEDEGYDAV
jgi:hypothetical protein